MPWERRRVAERLCAEYPERLAAVLVATVRVLGRGSIGSQRKLRAAVRETLGQCSDGDVDAAVEVLGRAVLRSEGARGATLYALNACALPTDLRRQLGL
jgi:hypothetical protein